VGNKPLQILRLHYFSFKPPYIDFMKIGGSRLSLELMMLLFTAVLAMLVLLPIYLSVKDYPFYYSNILFIVVFVTFARYIFLLKHTVVARSLVFKIVMMVTAIPIIMYLLDCVSTFQGFTDDIGLEMLVPDLSIPKQKSIIRYIRTEMIFFGVGAVIVAVMFPFRMLVSIWRGINKNTV